MNELLFANSEDFRIEQRISILHQCSLFAYSRNTTHIIITKCYILYLIYNYVSNSKNIDWNDVVKKEARGSDDEDLGEVQETGQDYVLV